MVTVMNIARELCDVNVMRPTVYGNPFTHHKVGSRYQIYVETRDEAVESFAVYWYSERSRWLREKALKEIPVNAKLGCVCVPERCHAEIIAGYLNWKRNVRPIG